MSELEKYKDYKTILASVAFLRCGGKVLFLKRSKSMAVDPGFYSGVGGKVEPGESFLEAIVREVQEETGLTIPTEKFHPGGIVQAPDPVNNAEWVMAIFTSDLDEQVQIPSNEDGDFFWIDPAQTKDILILPELVDYLKATIKDPPAYVLTFCKHDNNGKVIEIKTAVY